MRLNRSLKTIAMRFHQGCRLRARSSVLSAIAMIVLPVLALLGCVTATPTNPNHLDVTRITRVTQLCEHVMGIQPGNAKFVDCVSSLSRSAERLPGDDVRSSASATCSSWGVSERGARLSDCVSKEAQARAIKVAADSGVPRDRGREDLSVMAALNRERTACAWLGFEVGTRPFSTCVADLHTAISERSEEERF